MERCNSGGGLTGGAYDIYAKNARFDTIKFGDSNQVGFNIYLYNNLDDHRIDGSMDVSPNRGEGGYVTFGIRGIDTTCESKIGSNMPMNSDPSTSHIYDNPPLRQCFTNGPANPVYHITGIANVSNRQDIQASNSTDFKLTVRGDFTGKSPSLSADLGYPFYISGIDIKEIVTSRKTGIDLWIIKLGSLLLTLFYIRNVRVNRNRYSL